MEDWKEFFSRNISPSARVDELKAAAGAQFGLYGIYPGSLHCEDGSWFCITRGRMESKKRAGAQAAKAKSLIVYGKGNLYGRFHGVETSLGSNAAKVCPLSNENCDAIREVFPYTKPSSHKGIRTTFGLGDRLGLASPGHLRLIKDYPVFPVLAQQSARELSLTGRTFRDVLSAASWAVFQEGYVSGFGADGDHLKTAAEVCMALNAGFTMITLDCSKHINHSTADLSASEISEHYASIPLETQSRLERKYLSGNIRLPDGLTIQYTPASYRGIVLTYLKAVLFAIEIYHQHIRTYGRQIDFEVSIDETAAATSPEAHFFVASELADAGVDTTSLAPRFCGEFQKGIDYKGSAGRFAEELKMHAAIAGYFGYKLSIHSGSDKFTVFPAIGEITGGRYHLKTAGTHWLEAVRVIAGVNPALYRRMHGFALFNLQEARKYYHISAGPDKIPGLEKLEDHELMSLLDLDDARQVMHIAYGLILTAKNAGGSYLFREGIYDTLHQHEDAYYKRLAIHLGLHLEYLGMQKKIPAG